MESGHIKAYCGHLLCKNWKSCKTCEKCECPCIMARCQHSKDDKCERLFIILPCNHYVIQNCDCDIPLTEWLANQLAYTK